VWSQWTRHAAVSHIRTIKPFSVVDWFRHDRVCADFWNRPSCSVKRLCAGWWSVEMAESRVDCEHDEFDVVRAVHWAAETAHWLRCESQRSIPVTAALCVAIFHSTYVLHVRYRIVWSTENDEKTILYRESPVTLQLMNVDQRLVRQRSRSANCYTCDSSMLHVWHWTVTRVTSNACDSLVTLTLHLTLSFVSDSTWCTMMNHSLVSWLVITTIHCDLLWSVISWCDVNESCQWIRSNPI